MRRPPARSHNGIEQLEGLGALVNLKILDVANNRIKRLEGLETLQVGVGYLLCAAAQGRSRPNLCSCMVDAPPSGAADRPVGQ